MTSKSLFTAQLVFKTVREAHTSEWPPKLNGRPNRVASAFLGRGNKRTSISCR